MECVGFFGISGGVNAPARTTVAAGTELSSSRQMICACGSFH